MRLTLAIILSLAFSGIMNYAQTISVTTKDGQEQVITYSKKTIKGRGVQLGSGNLTLTPGSDAVNLAGRFFSRRVGLSGYFLTQPRPRLHLTLDVAGLPLEKL